MGLSVESLYRWTAILPVLLLYPVLYLAAQPRYGTGSALCIALAFGLGFSLASLRTPKLYARIVGIVFLLIYAMFFYYLVRGLRAHEAAA
jgi:carbon starvation protein CstA